MPTQMNTSPPRSWKATVATDSAASFSDSSTSSSVSPVRASTMRMHDAHLPSTGGSGPRT